MKKYIRPTILALFTSVSGMGAFAADGTVTFTGNVITSTCVVDVAQSASTVKLPTVATSAFLAANTRVTPTPFTIVLKNCPTTIAGPPALTTVGLYFEPQASIGANGSISGTNTASNVGIIITSSANAASPNLLAVAPTLTVGSSPLPTTAGGLVTYNLFASYLNQAIPAVTNTFNSAVNYTLVYN